MALGAADEAPMAQICYPRVNADEYTGGYRGGGVGEVMPGTTSDASDSPVSTGWAEDGSRSLSVSRCLKSAPTRPGARFSGFQPRRSTVSWTGRRPKRSASLQLHR